MSAASASAQVGPERITPEADGRSVEKRHTAFGVRHFWRRVRPSPAGCWEWTGTKLPRGYGVVVPFGKRTLAHRYAWASIHGPIPDGLVISHTCDNPSCVKPGHLLLTTGWGNALDMLIKGRNYCADPRSNYRHPGWARARSKQAGQAAVRAAMLRAVFLALVLRESEAA